MPKPVILVSSCLRDVGNGANQAIRDTWGRDSAIPYFFFFGKGNKIEHFNDVLLDVPDDYLSLTFKTKESLKWSREMGYTHAFRAFTDTFIDTERLAASNFEQYDYTGNQSELYEGGYTFAHGGPGYWCGPKAIRWLLIQPIDLKAFENNKFEDQWVGRTLGFAGITCYDNKRYSMGISYKKDEPAPLATNEIISEHLSLWSNQYEPDWMQQTYATRFGIPYAAKKLRMKGCTCDSCVERYNLWRSNPDECTRRFGEYTPPVIR